MSVDPLPLFVGCAADPPLLSSQENKIFAQRPLLVQGDGPMMRMRRWYSQFYSENSKTGGKPNVLELAHDW